MMMLAIPPDLTQKFETLLTQQDIRINQRPDYHKWLRYYLDFCDKYRLEPSEKRNFSAFDDKLRTKNQSEIQRQQARRAIAIYFRGVAGTQVAKKITQAEAIPQTIRQNGGLPLDPTANIVPSSFPVKEAQTLNAAHTQKAASNAKVSNTPSLYGANVQDKSVDSNPLKLSGANWVWVYDNLTAAIKVRHYSPKTLQAYKIWTQKLQAFTKSKDARLLTMADVKDFLSFLAVEKKVAASTQNQAFNALLFLFRHVLEKEFGKVEGVVRAKRRAYIPVVLSREEVNRVIVHLEYPYDLVAKLLYGCGLRLFECLKVRIQDLNFDMKV